MTGISVAGDVVHLGIDVGTSNTAAAVRGRDGQIRPVLFDGALVLPSAVFVDGETVLVGLDAQHAATVRPALLEPNPKRCVDDGSVLLGSAEIAVETLLAAVLRRVRDAAVPTAGPPTAVTLTYPVAWGARRLATLTDAARLAGLPATTTVHEPVAAAAHFVGLPGVDLAEGQLALVYDLGAGTFDATLIRRTAVAFEVVASQGLPDAGGLDIDAAIVASIRANLRPGDEAWQFLGQPRTAAELRGRRALMDGVRAAKEILSRTSSASIHVPVLEAEVPLGREQFEALARPVLDRTVSATRAVLRDAEVSPADLAAIFLVGGSTRIPLVGTLLHRAFGRPPVALDQPELAVAYGSVADGAPHVTRAVPAGGAVLTSQPPPAGAPPPAGQGDVAAVAVGRSGESRRRRWARRLAGHRRWAAAGLGLVLVALVGLAYLAATHPGRRPSANPPATPTTSPNRTGTSGSTTPVAGTSGPSATRSSAIPAPFVGRWSGIVRQPGGVVTSWHVTAVFDGKSAAGTFQSSSLGCSGTLSVVAPRPTEREMHLRQRTTRNPRSICVDAANWTLIVSGQGDLEMFWQQVGVPDNVATATLVRS